MIPAIGGSIILTRHSCSCELLTRATFWSQPHAAHLGDFQVRPRVLLITAISIVVGGAAAAAAFLLLRVTGLITSLVFDQRMSTALVAPGAIAHPWWLVLLAPVAGGLVTG